MHPPLSDGHTQSVPSISSNGKSQPACALQVGQVFIPRRVFNSGVFVPEALLACRSVSNGAKLLWARLARYAGTNGRCFPLLATLAADLGFSERQVQRYLAELVSGGFLRARQRGFNKSNMYEFLWHPALAGGAPGTVQTVQQKHNSTKGDFSLCEGVKSPYRLFHAAEPQELAATGATDSTTTLASYSTTGLSSCVSTTDLSSWERDFKNKTEKQAKPSRIVEVVAVPAGSACPSPENAKREPLTPEETAVLDILAGFQVELKIVGTILPSTVRRVMASVLTECLPDALRFVADKLYWRRRNESSYRSHVGWGFVLLVLEQDLAAPAPSRVSPVEPPVNPTGTMPPFAVLQRRPPQSSRQRGGLFRAGEILAALGVVAATK